MAEYKFAQVCLNGHPTTSDIQLSPERLSEFCPDCGEPTTTKCESCDASIRGYYYIGGILTTRAYIPPNYCFSCGTPFPWARRQLDAANALIEELEGLSDAEIKQLRTSIPDLAKDTPQTQVSAVRYKRLLGKAKGAAVKALENVVVNLATEGAKKLIGM